MARKRQKPRRRPKRGAGQQGDAGSLDRVAALWDAGREKEALKQAERIYQRKRTDAHVAMMYANMLLLHERADEGVAVLEPLAATEPEGYAGAALSQLAVAYLMTDRPAAARRAARLAEEHGLPPEMLRKNQELLATLPTFDEILQSPTPLLPSLGERVAVLGEEASVLSERGDYVAALQKMEEAVVLAPHLPFVHFSHADALFAAGRHEEGIARTRATLDEMDVENIGVRAQLVSMLWLLGRREEAEQAAQGLAERAAAGPDGLAVASALGYLGRHEAIHALLSQIDPDERGEGAVLLLAMAAANLGRREEAERLLLDLAEEGLELFLAALRSEQYEAAYRGRFPYHDADSLLPPRRWDDLLNETRTQPDEAGATIAEYARQFPGVLDAFEQWLYWEGPEFQELAVDALWGIDSEDALARLRRWTESGVGDPEAVAFARSAMTVADQDGEEIPSSFEWEGIVFELQQQPARDYPSSYANELGRAADLAARGKSKEAEEVCSRLIFGWPQHPPAWSLRAGVRLDARRAKEAEQDARQALLLDPERLEVRCTLALAQLRQGDSEAAQSTLRELMAPVRTTPLAAGEYFIALAMVTLAMGNFARARACRDRAERLVPESRRLKALRKLIAYLEGGEPGRKRRSRRRR